MVRVSTYHGGGRNLGGHDLANQGEFRAIRHDERWADTHEQRGSE